MSSERSEGSEGEKTEEPLSEAEDEMDTDGHYVTIGEPADGYGYATLEQLKQGGLYFQREQDSVSGLSDTRVL